MLISKPPATTTREIQRDLSTMLKFREKKSITDLDLRNKKVLVRVDFNVPLDNYGNITDSRRIRHTLPTIHYLLNENCRIILISHIGRPEGKIVESLKIDPIYRRLKEYLPFVNVYKAENCIGDEVEKQVSDLKKGEILVLENPRFHPEEKQNRTHAAPAQDTRRARSASSSSGGGAERHPGHSRHGQEGRVHAGC